MPIQCPQCKAVNRDTATFCDSCGGRLIVSSGQEIPVPSIPAPRPTNLPEEGARTVGIPPSPPPYQQPAHSTGFSTVHIPNAKFGRPRLRHPWRWLFFFVLAVGLIGGVYTAADKPWIGFLEGALTFAGIVLAIGLPLAIVRSQPVYTTGIVTHMRPWMSIHPEAPKERMEYTKNWIFDLRCIDRSGQPLMDKDGYTLPTVEVEFREDLVHGQPLEEGCFVVVRGKYFETRFKSRDIWNSSKTSEVSILGGINIYYGKVMNIRERSAPDLRYPGSSLQIWTFLLQQTDQQFNLVRNAQEDITAPLPVEIRAQSIGGSLGDGDKVELRGQMVRGVVYTKEIKNITAGGAQIVVREWVGIS